MILKKSVVSVASLFTHPRKSLSWVRRGHLIKDSTIESQTYWFTGELPRVSLSEVFAKAKEVDIAMPRAFDRKVGTSITAEEGCHLAAIVKCMSPGKVLEIGTYDGNTALLIAANLGPDGTIVTIDLPPDFDLEKQQSTLTYAKGEINLTRRQDLGRQYRNHPLGSRIRQVYGDSAALDWRGLGGPFDLVFIDGCHSEDYVLSDSRNALSQLSVNGIVVWHDYGMIPAVSKVVDELSGSVRSLQFYALKGTRLAVGVSRNGNG
jgi:predicted O-methyltransferase YrrM